MLDRRMSELNATIADYEAQERQLAAQIAQVEIDESRIERLLELCEEIAQDIDDLEFADKRHVVELLDLRGMMHRNGREYTIELTGILPETMTVSGQIKGHLPAQEGFLHSMCS